MKRLLLSSALATLVLGACSSAPESDEATVGEAQKVKKVEKASTYAVNTEESQIEWIGTKTTGRHHGTIDLQNGKLNVKEGKVVGGEFTFDMKSITVLDKDLPADKKKKLTGHLKSGDFFKVEQYPTAEFVITEVSKSSKTIDEKQDPNQEAISEYKVANPTHSITGNLTIRDSTKSVTFPAKVEVMDGKVTGVAKFNIDRHDWGLNWEYPPGEVVLNDTIHLGIKLVASEDQMAAK